MKEDNLFRIGSDVVLRLLGGELTDDSPIRIKQVYDWIHDSYAALAFEFIESTLKGEIPDSMRREIDCLPVKRNDSDCEPCPEARYFFKLEDKEGNCISILNLLHGKALTIKRGHKLLDRVHGPAVSSQLSVLNLASKAERYLRIGDTVYFMGATYVPSTRLKIYYVPSSTRGIDPKEPYPAPPELIQLIKNNAVRIGMRLLRQPADVTNEGIAA